MSHLLAHPWYVLNAAIACVTVWTLSKWLGTSQTTRLRGPPSDSLFFGVGKRLVDADDTGAMYESWAREYGPAYSIPWALGKRKVVLCDPKAIAHFYAKDTWAYIQPSFARKLFANFLGRGILWAHGEDHKRQRKLLTPAFSIAAIRQSTSVFYDSAYKAKGAWDHLIQSNGGETTLIDVQMWMNYISLDSLGIACFSHNFGALEGKHGQMIEVLDAFVAAPRSTTLANILFVLAQVFPFLIDIPTPRNRLARRLHTALEEISDELLARTRNEMEMGVVGGKEEKSLIGLFIKGANGQSEWRVTQDEVTGHMKVLLIAGYETTSASLSWALLELSQDADAQTRLRNELIEHGADPTYDQLVNGLPYLDAVVHEVLRLHPSIPELTRCAYEDDIIPLSEPAYTPTGKRVDSVTIAKGTLVTTPLHTMNRSTAIWGEDAKVFRPSRWLEDADGHDGIPAKAKEIQGHRHLLTFVDGPRVCLGKNFAVTEFKSVLTVLLKHFVFELREGDDSKIETGEGVLARPRLAGEEGCRLPVRVRPYVT